ncbi:YrbL family protein [Guyparkeria halophila]|uniref:YrbL family protein n=1 Tax=Guyparkeria halophila TaxID=47960 RepID=A0ABZ0YUL0_9GAMM|nr:YrbL family protein [Guyparkeria halophila]WQH15865.1 YrbL family protein [Guyparkeria halophila]
MDLITPLQLSSLEPVGQGAQKLVFRHPDDPRVLVKVVNPRFIERRDRKDRFYQKRRRIGHHRAFAREMIEHLASRALTPGRLAPCPHIQNILGVVDTDLGAALLVEAVLDEDGNLAPTLRDLVESGRHGHRSRQALETFLDWALTSNVLINDLSADNLAWHPDGHFVMIDGLGDRAGIPIRAVSPWLNRLYKRKKIRQLREEIGMEKGPGRSRKAVAVAIAIILALLGLIATQLELLLE